MFTSNGYPSILFDKIVSKFLNKKFSNNPSVASVEKFQIFVPLPFIGPLSYDFNNYLRYILPKYFPHIDFKLCFKNTFK